MMKTIRMLGGMTALLVALAPVGILAAPAPHAVAAPHERLLPLQGGRNFRDLGGYRTADGRTVKWGLLFRSGSMTSLTPADFTYLEQRGIRTICDFRDVHERAAEPVAWPAGHGPTVLADDYDMANNGMMPKMDGGLTPEKARAIMAATYPQMLVTFRSQYQRMFRELLAGHAPLAFNCSAGKDRTGVAAALLLTALGVPRETVVQDYLLTNRYLDSNKMLTQGHVTGAWAQLPAPVLRMFMDADRTYIEGALAVLDRHPGGAEGYLRDEMLLSPADIATLRRMYLE